ERRLEGRNGEARAACSAAPWNRYPDRAGRRRERRRGDDLSIRENGETGGRHAVEGNRTGRREVRTGNYHLRTERSAGRCKMRNRGRQRRTHRLCDVRRCAGSEIVVAAVDGEDVMGRHAQ